MFHVDLSPFGVDVERLRRDRLHRLQRVMRARGLGGLSSVMRAKPATTG